ncbi:MAG: helix-turn-helix domain-containing protein [Cyanobacteria bacterium P01_H01_bin.21]
MSKSTRNEFLPDYVSPPGDTLLEILNEQGMTQVELAHRTGRPKKTINEIIKGKAILTPETALQLEYVLGIPAHFWNSREQQYRETLARLDERKRLNLQTEWLKGFPIKKMIQYGWILEKADKVEQLEALLSFFGIASSEQWENFWQTRVDIAFRKSESYKSNPRALIAWLRKGEIEGQKIICAKYQREKFEKALRHIRKLTLSSPESFQPKMQKLCADAGVALVFVPQLPKTFASGATHWLSTDKALIQLSLRYKTDDHLWFSFFHEAGHILLHRKKDFFVEFNGRQEKTDLEKEADAFAANCLISKLQYDNFVKTHNLKISKSAIQNFANEIGIAPGVVVGMLQHDQYLPYSHCNGLKRRLEWTD